MTNSLRRCWKTGADDSAMTCYFSLEGKITLRELFEYLAEHYPKTDPSQVSLQGQATWDDPPTGDELSKRRQNWDAHNKRHAKWEREMFTKLKAKFEPNGEVIGQ